MILLMHRTTKMMNLDKSSKNGSIKRTLSTSNKVISSSTKNKANGRKMMGKSKNKH